MADQVRDGDEPDSMFPGELLEVGHPSHRAVLVHHFADDSGGIEPGDAGEVDRRLGLPRALEHPSWTRAQGKHVAGPHQVRRGGLGVDGRENGTGAIGGGDPRRNSLLRLDGNAERGPVVRGILRDHQRDAQIVEPLAGHRHANETAAVARHEVDGFRSDLLGGDGEVALVLAVLVVDDDRPSFQRENPRARPRWKRVWEVSASAWLSRKLVLPVTRSDTVRPDERRTWPVYRTRDGRRPRERDDREW